MKPQANKTSTKPARAVETSGEQRADPLFYSPDGDVKRVCLPDGRVELVGPEPRTLMPAFWREAAKVGCEREGGGPRVALPHVPDVADPIARRAKIKAIIVEAFRADATDPRYTDAFNAQNEPNLAWLAQRLNFNVDKPERDDIWREVVQEADEAAQQDAERSERQRSKDDANRIAEETRASAHRDGRSSAQKVA